MELHWLSFLVITILMSNSVPCFCDTPNDIYSYKRGYPKNFPDILKAINNIALYTPSQYTAQNMEGVQGLSDRRGKYLRFRQQEKQDTKKLKKLKAAIKKVLPPLLRLLQDDRDNYTEEDSSGQGFRARRGKYMRLRQQEKQNANKLKKLKATIKKVLLPLLRLLQDNRDNYIEEDSSGQRLRDRRGKYLRLRQQEKQDAIKLQKLKATIKKVLPSLQRLLRDDRDYDRDNYSEEDNSGQGLSDRRGKHLRLSHEEKQDAKKLKKLKATLKKVLPPLLRLLRDDRDDDRDNYPGENSSYTYVIWGLF